MARASNFIVVFFQSFQADLIVDRLSNLDDSGDNALRHWITQEGYPKIFVSDGLIQLPEVGIEDWVPSGQTDMSGKLSAPTERNMALKDPVCIVEL